MENYQKIELHLSETIITNNIIIKEDNKKN